MTDQSMDPTKIQFGEPLVSLQRAEMTQRQLITKALSSIGDSSQSWEPRVNCTAHR